MPSYNYLEQSKTEVLPPKAEWGFSRAANLSWDAPQWEACYYYEFTREAMGSVREKYPHYTIGQCQFIILHHAKGDRTFWKYWFKKFFQLFPEWPDKPFLAISEAEIRKRIKPTTVAKTSKYDDAVMQWDLNYVIGTYRDHARVPPSLDPTHKDYWKDPDCLYEFSNGEYNGPLQNGRGTIVTRPGAEFVCLEIDWSLGKTNILQGFKQWMQECCPQNVPWSGHEPNPRCSKGSRARLFRGKDSHNAVLGLTLEERRGGANATRERQFALKCLGAWRISRQLKANWHSIYNKVDDIASVLGDQFKHQPAWSRAIKKVDHILSRLNG